MYRKPRLNRHAAKRKHKREMKKRYGHGLYMRYRTNTRLHEDECRREYGDRPNVRNGGYEYWQAYYLTGPRKYAKGATNGIIRSRYRDILRRFDPDEDDIQALRGSDYEKLFDFWWTLF